MPTTSLNSKLSDLIYKISRLMKEEGTLDPGTSRLTLLQLHALIFLKKQGEAHMREIAENFRVEMPTATSLLNKLCAMNLVIRKSEPKDRRIVKIILTKQGEELLKKAKAKHSQRIDKMLSHLSESEKKNLLVIFQTLIKKMEQSYEK